jgi:hypothetical protein
VNANPPSITLLGPPRVHILQGTPYKICRYGQNVTDPCDQGAVAFDVEDGELTAKVAACSNSSRVRDGRMDRCCPGWVPVMWGLCVKSRKSPSLQRQVLALWGEDCCLQ